MKAVINLTRSKIIHSKEKEMKEMKESTKPSLVRRKLVQSVWTAPIVSSVVLPAHAQTSPIPPTLYAIGDSGPCGGIVYYITNGGLNGLEAAPSDQGVAEWGCDGTITGASGLAIGDGAANTAAILAAGLCAGGSAAELASNYAGGGCTGWYLPSRDELDLLYNQRGVVGGFDTGFYWSSSESSSVAAWGRSFGNGGQGVSGKGNALGVRAVRAF
ncbi:MAG: hypothetical protein ACI9J2_001583 [Saprospiraceae bacterium]